MPSVQSQPTLVEQVVNAIVSEIVEGQLPANSRLIQDELARAYGVSRQPVQQALLLDRRERQLLSPRVDLQTVAGVFDLVADFLVNPGDYENALAQLVAARHEVKAIHVMGDRECAGAYPPGAYRVRDCETGELREVTFSARESEICRQRVERHAERLSSFCARHGIVYSRAHSDLRDRVRPTGAGSFYDANIQREPSLQVKPNT